MTEGVLNLGEVEMPATPDAPVALVSVWEGESFGEPVPVAVSDLQAAEEPEAARAYGSPKPKRKPAKRAAQPSGRRLRRGFCKTGPGGGIDNSCGTGKGGGGVAKAGNGPLVKAARDEHKKALDKLRKNIGSAVEKARLKHREAMQKHAEARIAMADHHKNIVTPLQEETNAANEAARQNPTEENWNRYDQKLEALMDAKTKLSDLEKSERSAAEEKDRAGSEKTKAIARVLEKECAAVDKEDGFTASDRKRSIKAVEETHASGVQITKWAEDNGADESVDISRQPYAAAQREEAQSFLRSAVNPMIHTAALEGSIEYREGVRANAQGAAKEFVDSDTGDRLGVRESVGRTQLSPQDSASVVIHEFGHQVEHGNIEAAKLCHDFLESRTRGETSESFSSRFVGSGYGQDEQGSPDDFGKAVQAVYGTADESIAYYAGKKYAGNGKPDGESSGAGIKSVRYGATEVLAIGMELLSRDAKAFASADPEWFDLVAGISTGRILSQTRAKRRSR